MPDIKLRLLPETEREIDSATFNGTFLAIGTPINHRSRMLIFVNNSLVNVKISWDGVNNHFTLLPGATVVLDEQSNSVPDSEFVTAALTQFYAKGAASTGSVFLSTFYAF